MTAPAAPSAGSPASSDRRAVRALIGREPFTGFRVAVRCPHGGPAVLENAPEDLRGRPFPTRNWLACRALAEAVSRLEAAGGVRELEADPAMAEHIDAAHRRHAALHAGYRVAGAGDPAHVKCLHAHLAFGLACGGSPVADWIMERAGAAWPERCCVADVLEEGR
jgi:hypothetical protein